MDMYVVGRTAKTELFNSVLLLLTIALGVFLAILQLVPPHVVRADAPRNQFSAERALRHLETIAQRPRPMGSSEHERVRTYITSALQRMGLQTEIQTTTAVNADWGAQWQTPISAGTIHNILGRLAGTASTKAVLLLCHYDSVPNGPGASDDGAAVAVLLETIRALQTETPLRNDVIVLFTDGEEQGLLGMQAFVSEHPWAKEVGLVFNFEARGTSGPSVMFETSPQNSWMIQEFIRAAPYPVANSLSSEIYKLLPNSTDMTIWVAKGGAGLNFAYIGGFTQYHTELDTIQNLDRRSLQHHGSYALALARHFGNLSLENVKAPDAVFFNVIGSFMIWYPAQLSGLFTAIVCLLFLVVVGVGLRRRFLRFSGVALGVILFLLTLIAICSISTLVWFAIQRVHPSYQLMIFGETYNSALYSIGFVLLGIGLTAALYQWFCRNTNTLDLAVGGLVWWLVLMVLTTLFLPGASYLFTWPLLFSLIGVSIVFTSNGQMRGLLAHSVLYLSAIPGIVLLVPVVYMLFITLGIGMVGVVMVCIVLLLASLVPHMRILGRPRAWLMPGLSILISFAFFGAGSLTADFSPTRPRPNNVAYVLNTETQRASWISTDAEPDAWTTQFLAQQVEKVKVPEYLPAVPGYTPLLPADLLQAPAPTAPLEPPQITILDNRSTQDRRSLHLRIVSARHAQMISLHVYSPVSRATINGRPVISGPEAQRPLENMWALRYWAVPDSGIEVTLEIPASSQCRINVADHSYGLPDELKSRFSPRPASMIATPFIGYIQDSTMVITPVHCS